MPVVNAKSKVLVTGANGFVATWIIQSLLDKGYLVRGSVRSAAKAEVVKKKFEKYADKLELVVVEDIIADGAFDDAVKGVEAIQHTAGPFHFNAIDPQDIIEPAVKGTISILESSRKHGSELKRFVLISSCAAVCNPYATETTIFSENDWNKASVDEVERLGKDAAGSAKYETSKVLSERAAWDFYEKNKGGLSWDLTVLNPPYIFGPVGNDFTTPDTLNTSSLFWFGTVIKGINTSPEHLGSGQAWLDVRDLGVASVLALEKEEAGGERIIVAAGPFIWQNWLDVIHGLKTPPTKHTIPKGLPELTHRPPVLYDVTKAERVLGFGSSVQYRTMEQAAVDSLLVFESKGL